MPHSVQNNLDPFSSFLQAYRFINNFKVCTSIQKRISEAALQTLPSSTPEPSCQPRKKRNYKKISKSQICALFYLPIGEASKELDISENKLRGICRKYGIYRWPYRRLEYNDRQNLQAIFKENLLTPTAPSSAIQTATTIPKADGATEDEGLDSTLSFPPSDKGLEPPRYSEIPPPSIYFPLPSFTSQKENTGPLPSLASLALLNQPPLFGPEKLPPIAPLSSSLNEFSNPSQISLPPISSLLFPPDLLSTSMQNSDP